MTLSLFSIVHYLCFRTIAVNRFDIGCHFSDNDSKRNILRLHWLWLTNSVASVQLQMLRILIRNFPYVECHVNMCTHDILNFPMKYVGTTSEKCRTPLYLLFKLIKYYIFFHFANSFVCVRMFSISPSFHELCMCVAWLLEFNERKRVNL